VAQTPKDIKSSQMKTETNFKISKKGGLFTTYKDEDHFVGKPVPLSEQYSNYLKVNFI
jgi:hypothetical protein